MKRWREMNPKQQRAYKTIWQRMKRHNGNPYAKYSKWFRWRQVVQQYLGPIPAVRSLGRPAVRKP